MVNYQEELLWFQCSRAKWLIGGDRNTRYYHLKATARKKTNQVLALRKSDGNWEQEETNIKLMMNDHYKTLFSDPISNANWFQTLLTYPVVDGNTLQNCCSSF